MFEHDEMDAVAQQLPTGTVPGAPVPARSSLRAVPRPPRDAGERDGAVRELQSRISAMQRTRIDDRAALPTAPAIAPALPGGALRAGSVYSLPEPGAAGTLSLGLAMLAEASRAGLWCGAIGLPDLAPEAAAALGIDLRRLVLVPRPGEQWLRVTAAVADALDLVLVQPGPAAGGAADAALGRLGARLRERGASLVALGAWPGSEAALRVTGSRWSGLGAGHGLLEQRELRVETSSRGGRVQRATIVLPGAGAAASAPAVDDLGADVAAAAREPAAAAMAGEAVELVGLEARTAAVS